MAENSKIEWCDSTFNPWSGCTKVGPGCDNCYAEALSKRAPKTIGQWGTGASRRRTSAAYWKQPLRWNRTQFVECMACGHRCESRACHIVQNPDGFHPPLAAARVCPACMELTMKEARRRVFCASMADVFDNEVDPQWRDELFGLIAATPNLDWLILTKRISNARAYLTDPATPRRVETMKHVVLAGRLAELHAPERIAEIPDWPGYFITSKGLVLSDRTNAGTRGTDRHELKPKAGAAGHSRVMLQVWGDYSRPLIHRLVLEAFDRKPRGEEQGCHIDGDATNNALWNLRWGDQSSNWSDSKRHGTRRRYSKLSPSDVEVMRARAAAGEAASSIAPDFGVSDTQVRNILRGDQWKPETTMEWPLPWVWLGATVVNQAEADRDIPKLLAVPAAVRFLSIEPMLGPVDLTRVGGGRVPIHALNGGWGVARNDGRPLAGHRGIDWVIAGGESGPKARPSHPDWFRVLRDDCVAAGVPFLFKQWGEWNPLSQGGPGIGGTSVATHAFPDGYISARIGKQAAGRMLDGREWSEFPA